MSAIDTTSTTATLARGVADQADLPDAVKAPARWHLTNLRGRLAALEAQLKAALPPKE
jgi:hypothetical protein